MTDRATRGAAIAERLGARRTHCRYCGGRVFGSREWCWRRAVSGGHKLWEKGGTKYDGWLTPRRRLTRALDKPLRRVGL